MTRALFAAALIAFVTQEASAQNIFHGPKYYSGHNPPVRFSSGVYGGYAGSAYYLSPKIYPSPFPGYHWADPTLFSTGPGVPFANSTGNYFYGNGTGSPRELLQQQAIPTIVPAAVTK